MHQASSEESLSESLEDYLETVLLLSDRQERVGTNDVAQAMGVKAASATRALKELASRELVDRKPYGAIELTENGRQLAKQVLRKHRALTRFFSTLLGVEAARVEEMACHLEHVMPDDILERVITFADYVGNCPRGRVRWTDGEVSEDEAAAEDSCRRCGDDGGHCPALFGLQAPAGPGDQPIGDLVRLAPGAQACLLAFRDQGDLHQRCSAAGFPPGAQLRVLGVQEGIITLLNEAGQALALTTEEAALVLVAQAG
jgi:DtxR family Mn-dependent transcriptional regulator